MIRVTTTGRHFQMRYATRTARLLVAWIHEPFCRRDIFWKSESSARVSADIYTKAFTDAEKLLSACWLIDAVDPGMIKNCIQYVTYDEPNLAELKQARDSQADREKFVVQDGAYRMEFILILSKVVQSSIT